MILINFYSALQKFMFLRFLISEMLLTIFDKNMISDKNKTASILTPAQNTVSLFEAVFNFSKFFPSLKKPQFFFYLMF